MSERNVLVLLEKDSPWQEFLAEFFEDTKAKLFLGDQIASSAALFDKTKPVMVFCDPALVSLPLSQRFKAAKVSHPNFQVIRLGSPVKKPSFTFDAVFPDLLPLPEFQKKLAGILPLPQALRILVIDDEPAVGVMMRDYLENRSNPSFSVEYAENGEVGLKRLRASKPDVVLLDIKMPVMDGREVYRCIVTEKIDVPVIVFFDAVMGFEVEQIYKIGKPAVLEKGAYQSSMPELLSLIQKMVYFG